MLGVSFFFVLSGFVLAYSAPSRDSAGNFWLRRIARIYPMHLATALAAIALAPLWPVPAAPAGGAGTAANLLLISSCGRTRTQILNPVSWSLTCEAFFYACFPLMLRAVQHVRSASWLYALLGAVIGATIVQPALATGWHVQRDLRFYPPARLSEFVAGLMLAVLVRRGQWRGPGIPAAAVVTLGGYILASHVTQQ